MVRVESGSQFPSTTQICLACGAGQNFSTDLFFGFELTASGRRATTSQAPPLCPKSQRRCHGAFSLLRSYNGCAKILHSCRAVPSSPLLPPPHMGCLLGAPLSDDDWRLASLGIAAGGMGARSAQNKHLPRTLPHIWPIFDPLDTDERTVSDGNREESHYRPSRRDCHLPSQRSTSDKLQASRYQTRHSSELVRRHRRIHSELCWIPRACAWLTTLPNSIETHAPLHPPPLFRVIL